MENPERHVCISHSLKMEVLSDTAKVPDEIQLGLDGVAATAHFDAASALELRGAREGNPTTFGIPNCAVIRNTGGHRRSRTVFDCAKV
jgi:hypothetical protein